jgi:Holliday junction resolvase RusA-like endonuclease
LWVPGKAVGKARPRVTRNGTYLPPTYKQWRHTTEIELLLQVRGRTDLPIPRAEIKLELWGKQNLKLDLDNAAGAILDCLVAAQIIRDDRLNCITSLAIAHYPQEKKQGIWVCIGYQI